ncbi:MerR family transcriptional regulator [Pseudorhodobacter sp.]|uniref:MerR family transcriptional regulator n=1 Tax=Pseudorhodobacter sp. TaxID=1934400 RepID=UPI0026473D2B|nr:MerR family transcriptional regulator [Pseudorhodobacter sp.]MDN5788253.1 MerR family transcriptional regulator [Pseudorhodobacter sp.]
MSKSPDAFRTISEVAELLETPAHVLRFWESRFPQIKPVKRAGGRRYYRPSDMALLSGIRRLLHEEGMTIRGVQKILREQGVKFVSDLSEEETAEAGFVDLDAAGAADDLAEAPRSFAPIPLFPASAPIVQKAPPPNPDDGSDEAEPAAPDIAAKVADNPFDEPREEEAVSEGPFSASDTADDPSQGSNQGTAADDLFAPEVENIFTADPEDVPERDVENRVHSEAASDNWPFTTPPHDTGAAADDDLALSAGPVGDLDIRDTDDVGFDLPDDSESTDPSLDSEHATAPPQTVTPSQAESTKRTLPEFALPDQPVAVDWLAADLRALPRGALLSKRDTAQALLNRLQALRDRVGDLGRVPRR